MITINDLKKLYRLPESLSDFILLQRQEDNNRFMLHTEGDKASDVIAKIIAEYKEGDERDKFVKKILDKVKAFDVIKK